MGPFAQLNAEATAVLQNASGFSTSLGIFLLCNNAIRAMTAPIALQTSRHIHIVSQDIRTVYSQYGVIKQRAFYDNNRLSRLVWISL